MLLAGDCRDRRLSVSQEHSVVFLQTYEIPRGLVSEVSTVLASLWEVVLSSGLSGVVLRESCK